MKKVMLVASLGATLMLGACSSDEESKASTTPETNTESLGESATVNESQESSNTLTGWVEGDYDTYTKTIEEQVVLDNDIMKITLTGNLEADEDDVDIEYTMENKTNSSISCFLTDSEMDGAMVEIKGIGEANANTKTKGKFSLERESLFEDDLNKLSTVKSAITIELGDDYLKDEPVIEFSLK